MPTQDSNRPVVRCTRLATAASQHETRMSGAASQRRRGWFTPSEASTPDRRCRYLLASFGKPSPSLSRHRGHITDCPSVVQRARQPSDPHVPIPAGRATPAERNLHPHSSAPEPSRPLIPVRCQPDRLTSSANTCIPTVARRRPSLPPAVAIRDPGRSHRRYREARPGSQRLSPQHRENVRRFRCPSGPVNQPILIYAKIDLLPLAPRRSLPRTRRQVVNDTQIEQRQMARSCNRASRGRISGPAARLTGMTGAPASDAPANSRDLGTICLRLVHRLRSLHKVTAHPEVSAECTGIGTVPEVIPERAPPEDKPVDMWANGA